MRPGSPAPSSRGCPSTSSGTITDLDLAPGFSIMGIGLRFTKPAGPLLDLGAIQLDGIAFHVYAEATGLGVGGGANLELVGLGWPQVAAATTASRTTS